MTLASIASHLYGTLDHAQDSTEKQQKQGAFCLIHWLHPIKNSSQRCVPPMKREVYAGSWANFD